MTVKRSFDLIVGGLLLILALLPMAGIAIASRLTMGSPVLFRAQRPGVGGRLFTLYKFRTMTDERDAAGDLLPDGQRITPLGGFLRSTSLDELPELFNVMKGDMSLVGPRPLLPAYLDRYTEVQARRHEVRPGLTGLAQVRGRNAQTWEERFEYDVWYVDNHNVILDVVILFETVGVVLRRRGVSAEGHATMPEFKGTDES